MPSDLQPEQQLLLLLLIIAAVFILGMGIGSKWEESDSKKLRKRYNDWSEKKTR